MVDHTRLDTMCLQVFDMSRYANCPRCAALLSLVVCANKAEAVYLLVNIITIDTRSKYTAVQA